jgi:mRNA interferase HicA
VKRQAFIRELEQAGCELLRHGKRQYVFHNPASGQQAAVPRHREIANTLCEVIRKQLGCGKRNAD